MKNVFKKLIPPEFFYMVGGKHLFKNIDFYNFSSDLKSDMGGGGDFQQNILVLIKTVGQQFWRVKQIVEKNCGGLTKSLTQISRGSIKC